MQILIIDNFDSFTYNLKHYAESFADVRVERNDAIALDQMEEFDAIIISPGPGLPSQAGVSLDVIHRYAGKKPILGVCLGLQCIVEAYNGRLQNLNQVLHGVTSQCKLEVEDEPLFIGVSEQFQVGHYHSWVADPVSFPDVLEITAKNDAGWIMALRHRVYNLKAVQFHPESVLTPEGFLMIKNWIHSIELKEYIPNVSLLQ